MTFKFGVLMGCVGSHRDCEEREELSRRIVVGIDGIVEDDPIMITRAFLCSLHVLAFSIQAGY